MTYLGCIIGLSFGTKSAPKSRLISKNSCQKAIAFCLPNTSFFGTKSAHLCPQISLSHHKILLFFCQIFPNKTSSPQSISLLLPILNLSLSLCKLLSLSLSLVSYTSIFFPLSLSLYSPTFLSLSCSHTHTLAFSPQSVQIIILTKPYPCPSFIPKIWYSEFNSS